MNGVLLVNELENFLETYSQKLRQAQAELECKLEKAPQGSLKIVCKKTCTQFYYRKSPEDKEGMYIPKKDRDLVKKLAVKKYAEKAVGPLCKQIQLVEKMLACNQEKALQQAFEGLHKAARPLVEPVLNEPERLAQKCRPWNMKVSPLTKPKATFLPAATSRCVLNLKL